MSVTQNRIFLVVMSLLHLSAWIYSLLFHPETKDSLEYQFAADNFLQHHFFYSADLNEAIDMRAYSKRPPFYPLMIALVPRGVLLLLQNILSLMLVLLLHRRFSLGNSLTSNRFILYLLCWSFACSQFIYANLIMADIWLQLCIVLLFYLLSSSSKQTKPITWLCVTLVITAALLFKPVALFLALLFPLYLVFLGVRKLSVLGISLIPALVVLVISFYNHQNTGVFEYSSIGQINLLHYNTRYTLMSVYGNSHEADSVLQPLMKLSESPAEYATNHQIISRRCKEILLQHPWNYLLLHLKGMVQMPLDPGRFDLAVFFSGSTQDGAENMELRSSGQHFLQSYFSGPLGPWLALILLINIFKSLIFLYWLFMRSVPLQWRLTSLSLIVYIVGLTGPLGASRFMVALTPLFYLALFHFLQSKSMLQEGSER